VVGLYAELQLFPLRHFVVLLSGPYYVLPFSVPYAYMLLHCMCVLVCPSVWCLPHYCVLLTSGPALLEKFLVVLRWGGGGSLFLGWSGVSGGWEVGLLLLGFSKASKILFGVMLNSSFKWLLIENSL